MIVAHIATIVARILRRIERKLWRIQFGFTTGKDRDAENNIRINTGHICTYR